MSRAATRGLTPRDRLDRILQLLADHLGDTLHKYSRLSRYRDLPLSRYLVSIPGGGSLPLSDPGSAQYLDSQMCLKIVKDNYDDLFSGIASKRAKAAAISLIKLRNNHAHNRSVEATDVRTASSDARYLLNLFGLNRAADTASDLALPPEIAYVADLRRLLIKVARKGDLILYDEVLDELGLPRTEANHRQLYRQLNVLAAKQMITGEPQLCALVVLADGELPGRGFFWVVDVAPDAGEQQKRTAHREAIREVYSHDW